MGKKPLIVKWLVIGIIFLFIGTNIISSTTVTRTTHFNQREESARGINEIASPITEQDQVRLDHKSVRTESRTPSDTPSTSVEWITYGGENYLSIGVIGGYDPWEGAIRLTPVELAPYDGWWITTVKYFHGYQSNPVPEPPSHGNIKIYGGGSSTHPGVVLDSEPFWTPAGNAWFQFNLSNPVIINAYQEYWVSVEILDQNPGEYPLGIDAGPAVCGKGDFIGLIEGNWSELYLYGFSNNWNHMVGVESLNTLPPPIINGPVNGWTNIEYLFWTDPIMIPDGDSFFCKWDWDDGTITEWLGPYASGSVIYASHRWTHQGIYEIRAKLSSYNSISNWSEPHTITINESGPPNIPIITGPHYGRAGVAYNFTIMTTDPEGDDFFYLWSWGDGNFSGWMGPYASGEIATISHAWSEPGTYTIMVKLKDTSGIESDWSEFTIIIVRLKPAFFIGTFANITQTDDLIVLQARSFIVFPSFPMLYHRRTIVIAKEKLGYVGTSFAIGVGGIAIP